MRKTSLECIYQLALADERVVFIGSDLGAGVLDEFRKEIPNRWFMEGVAEQHILGMAAGLAIEGFLPYVNTIATFITRRCFEQIVVDVCLHELPVRLIGNGAGLVYAPLGPTHQAIEDIAIMRSVPNMTIVAPCDADEMNRVMSQTLDWPGPVYVRLGKGGDPIVSKENEDFRLGKAVVMREPGKVLLVSTGVMTQKSIEAADGLQQKGISCGLLHVHTIKPLDTETLLDLVTIPDVIITVEEHTIIGGLGSAVAETLMENGFSSKRFKRIGLPDVFPANYGSQDSLLERLGISKIRIENTAIELLT